MIFISGDKRLIRFFINFYIDLIKLKSSFDSLNENNYATESNTINPAGQTARPTRPHLVSQSSHSPMIVYSLRFATRFLFSSRLRSCQYHQYHVVERIHWVWAFAAVCPLGTVTGSLLSTLIIIQKQHKASVQAFQTSFTCSILRTYSAMIITIYSNKAAAAQRIPHAPQ
jgi:hypothetical protein